MDNLTAPGSLFPNNNSDSSGSGDRSPAACSGVGYAFWIDGIGSTSLCSFAILGNLICMVVLSRPSMKSSVNYILLALSISEFIFVSMSLLSIGLYMILLHFCSGSGYRNYFFPLAFPYIFPLLTTAQMTSVFLTVLVSAERFIAVCHPFRARIWCTLTHSVVSCAMVTLFSILYNLPTWWEWESYPVSAGYELRKTEFYKSPTYVLFYVNWGSFAVLRIIPFTLLIILNSLIYNEIRAMNKRRQIMSTSQSKEVSIAKMLICIVLIFLICNVTTIVSHMLEAFGGPDPDELTAASNFLLLFSSASNFVIYCFLGKNFRRVLLELIKETCPACFGFGFGSNFEAQ